MAWSWLGLLIGFALPLLVFIAAYFASSYLNPRLREVALALLAGLGALFSSITIIILIFSSPYWRDGTRIVWSGMQAHGEPLLIGGKQEETAIGWPNGAVFPKLKVIPQPNRPKASMDISGGGAFIFDEQKKRFLNGKAVTVGSTEKFGEYQIRVNRFGRNWRFWRWFSSEVEILDLEGQSLAGFTLRENRTRQLGTLLPGSLSEPLTHLDKIGDREKLEDWARDVWVIRIDKDRLYVLTGKDSATSDCELPAELTVKWVNLTLPIKISVDRANTTLDFASPWRFSSPLPPQKIDGCPEQKNSSPNNSSVMITSHTAPCMAALVLPFGHLAGNIQQTATIDLSTHKFNTPGAIDSEIPAKCPPGVKCETQRVGTSHINIQGRGAFSFYLTTVSDLPSRKGIAALIFLAFILFAGGLALVFPRMPATNRWVVYGLITTIWLFLSFRLLLAFRYALDPASLDRLSVMGITRAVFGLMIVPGLLLLWTRLRCDRYQRPADEGEARQAMLYALCYLLGLLSCGLGALYFTARLWSGLPDSYYNSIGDIFTLQGLAFIGIAGLFTLLLALHIKFLYKPDTNGSLVRLFVEPWYAAEKYHARSREFWDKHLNRTARELFAYVFGGVLAFLIFVALFLLARALPGDKVAQELAVPIIFYWTAILWIGLKLYLISHTPMSGQTIRLIISGIVMISLPAIAVPIAISDFGSILPILAILLPLIAVLLAGRSFRAGLTILGSGLFIFIAGILLPATLTLLILIFGLLLGVILARRAYKAGLVVAFSVILLFGFGGWFYQNLEGMILPNVKYISLAGEHGQGRVFARLLNYKKGSLAQQYAVLSNNVMGGEGLPYQELLNGNQHTWENKAIAHEGDLFGKGFGGAPVHRSQVRRDTLQYDSVFSFFVLSEYGFIGGLLLIFMYACPLLIISLGGRDRFDAGYALALIIAGAFLIECLYHAGMNLGAFPMSGRNLPMLSVNSPSDLLRWTLLWGLALQTIFWRYEGGGRIKSSATSLISGGGAQEDSSDAIKGGAAQPDGSATLAPREPLWAYSIPIWVLPALTALAVLINGWGVLREKKEFEKFNYEVILNEVKWYLENGVIEFNKQTKKLVLRKQRLDDPDAEDFIRQEVERFNSRTERERLEEIREQREKEFEDELRKVNSTAEYQQLIKEIGTWRYPEPKHSIFRMIPLHDEDGNIYNYKVTTNPNFNVSYSFKVGRTANEMPRVTYGGELLLGPAWVSGRYQTAINPSAPLPWIAYMQDALDAEWQRLKVPATARKIYGQLTLNKSLQDAAMKFMAAKGMELHETQIKSNVGSSNYRDKLPPRVALSIVSLPKGETLALGGWPRMTSLQSGWRQEQVNVAGAAQRYWLPSAQWLEREAPQSIAARYRGDRNFDRSVVMGSSTKPLWAAAVLKIHPKLSDYLRVTSAGSEESDVFGLRIEGKPWDLNGQGNGWVDFRGYLRQSDNRYQVRLGFLGLAIKDGNSIKSAGNSLSPNESLSGDQRPWGKYPQFLPSIKIGEKNSPMMVALGPNPGEPNTVLANSDLAKALRDMFSINVAGVLTSTGEKREFSFRRSFWTGDENDDLNLAETEVTSLFNQISPEAPDFAFDRLYEPREYVTMLLGGGTNLWANVDFAAAFGSCLTGRPVIAHIGRGAENVQTLEGRKLLDPEIASKIRQGLKDVVEDRSGTAYEDMSTSKALEVFKEYTFYAKTGTLKVDEDNSATSRIVLAMIKWKNEKKGEVASGIVFSVAAERGGKRTAARWLNDFISANKETIAKLLKEQR
jgi:hypothetical protein